MRQITYHIHRYQQGRAFVQTFKFDYEPDRTILWGLQKIKDTQDPTLTFLAACRSAVCGACSIRVNGEAMLGCESKIDELTERYGTDELTIAPIGNFRVIRDLVVDWESKVDRLKTVAPWIFLKACQEMTKITGREYHLFNYYGAEDAENIIILMGSATEPAREAIVNVRRDPARGKGAPCTHHWRADCRPSPSGGRRTGR